MYYKLYWCYFDAGFSTPARDYSIPGSNASKVFSTIGAAATLVFSYNTGMLPEIQVSLYNTNFMQ